MSNIKNFNGKEYVISPLKKGFLASELGGLTPWAQVMGTQDRLAYRVNPEKSIGNQYRRQRVAIPYTSENEAIAACEAHSLLVIIR